MATQAQSCPRAPDTLPVSPLKSLPRPLRVCAWNVQGMGYSDKHKTKVKEISKFIKAENIHICLLTEIKLHPDDVVTVDGYELYTACHPLKPKHRSDTPEPKSNRRAGSAVLIRNGIPHTVLPRIIKCHHYPDHGHNLRTRPDEAAQSDNGQTAEPTNAKNYVVCLQVARIEIELNQTKYQIGSFYAPAGHSVKMKHFVNVFQQMDSRFLLGGDFNCNLSNKTDQLRKAVEDKSIRSLVPGGPTFIPCENSGVQHPQRRKKKSQTIVDYFLGKDIDSIIPTGTTPSLLEKGRSDHRPILIELAPCHDRSTMEADFRFLRMYDPVLDGQITLEELSPALVSFEGKRMIEEGLENTLASLFNQVIGSRAVPDDLAKAVSLFGKGNAPAVMSFFLQVLFNRLLSFVTQNNLLPENQNGFRKGRGSVDSIFTLASLVQISTQLEGQKLFCAFIDYESAFDSIPHELLRDKLYKIGISARLLWVIRSLYEHAIESSKSYEISALSQLLFALFLTDFDGFLADRGVEGVSVSDSAQITSIFHAGVPDAPSKNNQLVLLAKKKDNMHCSLAALNEYHANNGLAVDAKSKVVVFQPKGRQAAYRFRCGANELEQVSTYTYLGVVFSRSGDFSQQAKSVVERGTAAYKKAWQKIIHRTQDGSPGTLHDLLFEAVSSTVMYPLEVWAYPYSDQVERVQARALKSLLNLAPNTPNRVVRSMQGCTHPMYLVGKAMFEWWCKLLSMAPSRLPRICFDRLLVLSEGSADVKFNWALQLHQLLESVDKGDLWLVRDPAVVKGERLGYLDSLKKQFLKAQKVQANKDKKCREKQKTENMGGVT